MCGRFVGNFSIMELIKELELEIQTPDDLPLHVSNFNTAPTHLVPVIRQIDGVLYLDAMQWGLVPVWAKDASIGSKMINARSETITEKVSFKGLVQGHRCIIPMNGFYEWNRDDPKKKVPYFVPRADGKLMLVAGLWTHSPILDNRRTFSLITRESIEDLNFIHSRSPVEFSTSDAVEWLTKEAAPLELFDPVSQPRFAPYPVSNLVNSVKNNSSSLIDLVDLAEETPEDRGTLF